MKLKFLMNLCVIFIVVLVLSGCMARGGRPQNVDEVPSMLNILTNKIQLAIEEGLYGEGGRQAVLQYVRQANPDIINWFTSNHYELEVGVVSEVAVVMVCSEGRPIFEDTYCAPGAPDKDHRNQTAQPCKITLTDNEVQKICN